MKCRNKSCDAEASRGRLRCSEHDHRVKVPADPTFTLGPGRGQVDHPDGFPTFEAPVVLPERVRLAVNDLDLSDDEIEVLHGVISAGLDAINLGRAERDYGRRDLLLRAYLALRQERRSCEKAEKLIEALPGVSPRD